MSLTSLSSVTSNTLKSHDMPGQDSIERWRLICKTELERRSQTVTMPPMSLTVLRILKKKKPEGNWGWAMTLQDSIFCVTSCFLDWNLLMLLPMGFQECGCRSRKNWYTSIQSVSENSLFTLRTMWVGKGFEQQDLIKTMWGVLPLLPIPHQLPDSFFYSIQYTVVNLIYSYFAPAWQNKQTERIATELKKR